MRVLRVAAARSGARSPCADRLRGHRLAGPLAAPRRSVRATSTVQMARTQSPRARRASCSAPVLSRPADRLRGRACRGARRPAHRGREGGPRSPPPRASSAATRDRLIRADLARQPGQRKVERELSECSARRGRSFRRSAAVHHGDLRPGLGKRIRDHRASDPGADHQHFGLDVAGEPAMGQGRSTAPFPDRPAGAQIP